MQHILIQKRHIKKREMPGQESYATIHGRSNTPPRRTGFITAIPAQPGSVTVHVSKLLYDQQEELGYTIIDESGNYRIKNSP